jgi:hypothetical protein
MGYTAWRFRRVSPGVFERVAANRFTAFTRREAALEPDRETGDVLLVEVIVEYRGRVAHQAYMRNYERFPVDGAGIRLRQHGEREGFVWTQFVAGVVGAEEPASRRFAARVMQATIRAEYLWEPTREDVRAVEHAINRRAKKFLLGDQPLRLA